MAKTEFFTKTDGLYIKKSESVKDPETGEIFKDTSEQLIFTFITDEKILKDRKYNLYAFIMIEHGKLYVKFGEAMNESIWGRWGRNTAHIAINHIIGVWAVSKKKNTDIDIHNKIRNGNIPKNTGFIYNETVRKITNTKESYEILELAGIYNLFNKINEYACSDCVEAGKIKRLDYKDVEVRSEKLVSSKAVCAILNYCTRYGKTSLALRLMYLLNKYEGIQTFFMDSYVRTVETSYAEDIKKYDHGYGSNCLFVDPDDNAYSKAYIKKWLADKSHYIVYYVALTGGAKNYENRINLAKELKLKDAVIFIEEADFGACCDNQIIKIINQFNDFTCKHLYAMTGSNASKCNRIIETIKQVFC